MQPDSASIDLGLLAETAVLVSARVLPLVSLTPIVGGNAVPRRLRIAIALAIGTAITPILGPQTTAAVLPFGIALAKEFLLGGVLALTVLVIIEAVAAAGEVIDLARGATFGNTINPLSQQPIASTLSPLFQQSLVATIAATGGLAWIVAAIMHSFTLCGPFDLGPLARDADVTRAMLLHQGLALAGSFFALAILLAAPVLIATFTIELSVAAIGRMAPSLQLGGLTAELKSVAALVIVVLVAGVVFRDGSEGVFVAIREAINLFGPWPDATSSGAGSVTGV
jgi:type III secretory pathway component EscT